MGYFDGVPMIAGNDYSSGLRYLGDTLDKVGAGQDAEKRRRDLLRQQAIENARKAEETRIKDEREKDWDLRNKRADNQRQADRNVRVTKDITTAVGRGGVTAGEAEAEANRYTDPETGKTVGAQFIAGVPEINDHLDMRPPEPDPAATGLAGMLGNKGPASRLSLTGQKPPEASQHMTLGGPDEPGPDGAMPPGGSADVPQWQKSFAQQLNGPAGATPDSVRADQYGENMKKDAAAEHRHAIQFDTGHKVFLDPHEIERATAEERFKKGQALLATLSPDTPANAHDNQQIRDTARAYMAGFGSTGQVAQGMQSQQIMEDKAGHTTSDMREGLTNKLAVAGINASKPHTTTPHQQAGEDYQAAQYAEKLFTDTLNAGGNKALLESGRRLDKMDLAFRAGNSALDRLGAGMFTKEGAGAGAVSDGERVFFWNHIGGTPSAGEQLWNDWTAQGKIPDSKRHLVLEALAPIRARLDAERDAVRSGLLESYHNNSYAPVQKYGEQMLRRFDAIHGAQAKVGNGTRHAGPPEKVAPGVPADEQPVRQKTTDGRVLLVYPDGTSEIEGG